MLGEFKTFLSTSTLFITNSISLFDWNFMLLLMVLRLSRLTKLLLYRLVVHLLLLHWLVVYLLLLQRLVVKLLLL